jgi:hypothetical protein
MEQVPGSKPDQLAAASGRDGQKPHTGTIKWPRINPNKIVVADITE